MFKGDGPIALYARVLVLWVARHLGAARHWLLTDWRFLALGFAACGEVLWAADAVVAAMDIGSLMLPERLFTPGNVASLFAVAVVGYWVWGVRRRTVVEEVANHTSEADKISSKGLSALLVSDLMRLSALCRAVDEKRPIQTVADLNKQVGAQDRIDPAIKVDDLGESLRGMVSAESKLAVGPLQLPIGAVMAIAGKLLQGSRITCSLHRHGEAFILTAQLVGRGRALAWRVEQKAKPTAEEQSAALASMVEELATRILRDTSFGGSVQWRALAEFMRGLDAYRVCLRTPKDRRHHLRTAEQAFMRAIALDEGFDLAYYNLGVAYTELEQFEAAEAAFLKAIAINPQRWSAYYALANHRFQRADFRSVIELCNRVIESTPDLPALAEAWNLHGRAHRRLEDTKKAMNSLRQAAYHTWKALVRAAYLGLRQEDPAAMEKLSQLAAVCLRNFAVIHTELAHVASQPEARRLRGRGIRLYWRALRWNPGDADLLYEIGKAYGWVPDYRRAMNALQVATQIAPLGLHYWSELAWCAANAGDAELARRAGDRVLECPSEAMSGKQGETPLDRLARAYVALGDQKQAERCRKMLQLAAELDREVNDPEANVQNVERRLAQFAGQGSEWERGKTLFELGRIAIGRGDNASAEKRFRDAMLALEGKHASEIVWMGLRTFIARSLRLRKRYSEALVAAEAAVVSHPLRSFEWQELVETQLALGDYSAAIRTGHDAANWKPNDPQLHAILAIAHWRLALDLKAPEDKRSNLAMASKHFNDALEGYGRPDARLWCRYWLGRLNYDLGEPAHAITHFRAVDIDTEERWVLTGPFWLGFAYLDDKNYQEAGQYLARVRTKAKQRLAEGVPPGKMYGPEHGDFALNTILSWACAGIAYAYAAPGIKLDQALDLVRESEEHAGGIEDEGMRNQCLAYAASCRGAVHERQGATEKASRAFEQAVTLNPASATHFLRLASALANGLDETQPAPKKRRAINRARVCLEQIRALDWKKEHDDTVKELTGRLDAAEAAIRAMPASRAA
jgi:tetratricopeptide (TPR) repeat protein